jgi:hypothetical protein
MSACTVFVSFKPCPGVAIAAWRITVNRAGVQVSKVLWVV